MNKNLIKQIVLEQKGEIKKIFSEKIIPRIILPDVQRVLDSNLIKVIIGVRRCGKSVLSHYLLKNRQYGYVNFDDERLIGVKTKDLNDFWEVLQEINPNCKFILLDEIQNIEGWELFVNRLKRNGHNIVVTGSNSKLLSKELATHLTGRHFSIELYPFSFEEFLLYKNQIISRDDLYIAEKKAKIKRLLEEYLMYGALPEVVKLKPKMQYLRELYDKIIGRDVIFRYSVKYARDLKEIALYAISNFGSKISYRKIKNIFEMKSVHTVKNYLNYLEEAYLLFQINAFSHKLKEQLKLPKKLYCIDTGIINAIIPRSTIDYGRLLENAVFIELKRKKCEIYFYAQSNYEVDFVIREGQKVIRLIQVSYSVEDEVTRKREVRALLKASRELRCNNLSVITWDYDEEKRCKGKKIKFIPLWKWLLDV